MDLKVFNKNQWNNPDNWSRMGMFGVYFSKADHRLFVPKATPAFGWTLNFGHRHAVLWLAVLVTLPVLLVSIILSFSLK
ncbi:MAG: DUF5808 domain-containing protein [Arenimonas sp.]